MSIESHQLLFLLFVAALGLPVLLVVGWQRFPGPSWARQVQRLTAVLLAQVMLTLAVLALVNDANDLFPTWSDLFPQHGTGVAAIAPLDPGAAGNHVVDPAGPLRYRHANDGAEAAAVTDAAPPPPGYIHYRSAYETVLDGPLSGVRARMYVWLPPEYFLPADAHVRFPVIEAFGGFPGSPTAWLREERLIPQYFAAQRAGAHPFILVMPTMNVAGRSDLECSDLLGYPDVGTFLSRDVPTEIEQTFRTLRGPRAWGAMGFSEGGFCALKMATFHSDEFGAAVSLSGYGYPTSPLFGDDPALRAANAPNARLAGPKPPAVDLLLTVSRQDRNDYRAFARTVTASRRPTSVYTIVTPRGGHRLSVWVPLLAPALEWFSRHLDPPSTVPGCLSARIYAGVAEHDVVRCAQTMTSRHRSSHDTLTARRVAAERRAKSREAPHAI